MRERRSGAQSPGEPTTTCAVRRRSGLASSVLQETLPALSLCLFLSSRETRARHSHHKGLTTNEEKETTGERREGETTNARS